MYKKIKSLVTQFFTAVCFNHTGYGDTRVDISVSAMSLINHIINIKMTQKCPQI